MKNRKSILVFASLLIVIYASVELPAISRAQQPTSIISNLPSDLSLDLTLAKQNPAPDQKEIVKSQIQQVEVVTTTGETNVITPQDTVAPQVKTELQADAIYPEQTTSEQVVTKTVTVQNQENTTPTPEIPGNQLLPSSGDTNNISPTNPDNGVGSSSINNMVPGTNVAEPDDNSAPTDNSGNPNLPAPTAAGNESLSPNPNNQQQTNSPSPSDNSGNTSQPSSPTGASTNDQQNIPLESQPQTNPSPNDQNQQQTTPSQGSDNGSPQQQPQGSQPSSDNSGSSGDSQSSNIDNSGVTPSVQGASTGPKVNFFQQVIINIMHFLTGK